MESDQGVHCVYTGIYIKNKMKMKKHSTDSLNEKVDLDSSSLQEQKSPIGIKGLIHVHEKLCENDKTNKMTVRPAKTQISLGIRPV